MDVIEKRANKDLNVRAVGPTARQKTGNTCQVYEAMRSSDVKSRCLSNMSGVQSRPSIKVAKKTSTGKKRRLTEAWLHRRSKQHQQFEEFVDLSLCPQVVTGVGALLSTDTDRNDIAVQGEGILVVFVVTHI